MKGNLNLNNSLKREIQIIDFKKQQYWGCKKRSAMDLKLYLFHSNFNNTLLSINQNQKNN